MEIGALCGKVNGCGSVGKTIFELGSGWSCQGIMVEQISLPATEIACCISFVVETDSRRKFARFNRHCCDQGKLHII